MKTSHFLVALLAITMSLTSCIVSSGDDPVEPDPVYTLRVKVDRIIVNLTCEGPNGDQQEADIYTKLWLAEGVSFPPTIAEQDYTLIQLGLNEQTTNTGLIVETEVDFEDGTQFNAYVDTYENDPGGVRDISKFFGKSLVFDQAEGCWKLGGVCVNGSTEFPYEFSVPFYERMSDSRCDIEYHWTFELEAN